MSRDPNRYDKARLLTEKKTCSICKTTYRGFGHNAFPYKGRCCNECNLLVVMPARFGELYRRAAK